MPRASHRLLAVALLSLAASSGAQFPVQLPADVGISLPDLGGLLSGLGGGLGVTCESARHVLHLTGCSS
jgi:hypothetical protein